MNKKIGVFIASVLGFFLFGTGAALADPPDFTSLTTVVDFSTVITALLSVMAALAGVFIVMRGGSLVLSKIRR